MSRLWQARPAYVLSPSLFRFDMVSRVLRMVLAVVIGVLCYQPSPTDFEPIPRLMMRWDRYLLAMLQLTWLTIFRIHSGDIEWASPQMHPERTWVLLLMIFVGTTTSLLAVVLLLRGLHETSHDERLEHVLMSLIAVAGMWLLLHRLFALHHAQTCFSQKQEPRPTPDDERGGLRFGGVAPLIILGSCPFLVHYRHDDPNGRYHRYLAAHAPAGAIS